MAREVRVIGAGGHAAVAADAWISSGGVVLAFHTDDGEHSIKSAVDSHDALHIAIGSNAVRKRIACDLPNLRFPPVIHKTAVLSGAASVAPGTLVGASAILQPRSTVGRHSIINTAALVEHDCVVGDFVHVAPGVRLAGNVQVDDGAFVGIGAVVIPGVRIGSGAIIGAGAVVLRDVPPGATVVGNPARTRD